MTSRFLTPPHWESTTFGEVTQHSLGKMLDRAKHNEGVKLPYLRNLNVQWDRIETADVKEMFFDLEKKGRYSLKEGDLLICEGGEPGRCAVWDGRDEDMRFQKALHRVRPEGGIPPRYLMRCLQHAAQNGQLKQRFTGSTIKHFTGRALGAFPVTLPPLNEQRRIVAKLDACMEHSRKAKESLDAIPPLLEKFRQSVLAAAFRGDLTKDWREQNPDVEPASELLERIRIERRQKWEEDYLAKQRAKGKKPKNDKWKAKYKAPEPVDPEALPELPRGWGWARLELLTPVDAPIVYGIVQPGPHVPDGVPFVRPADIRNSRVDYARLPRTSIEIAEKYARAALAPDDLVFSIVGTIGKWTVAAEELVGANITQSSVRLRPLVGFTAMRLLRLLQSPVVRTQMSRMMFGNAVQRLNVAHIRELVVPVPPSEEWVVLEATLEQALQVAHVQRDMARAGSRSLGALEKATLAKAFRGELVPQDPNDEPGPALLERIRAERAAANPEKSQRRKRKAAAP